MIQPAAPHHVMRLDGDGDGMMWPPPLTTVSREPRGDAGAAPIPPPPRLLSPPTARRAMNDAPLTFGGGVAPTAAAQRSALRRASA